MAFIDPRMAASLRGMGQGLLSQGFTYLPQTGFEGLGRGMAAAEQNVNTLDRQVIAQQEAERRALADANLQAQRAVMNRQADTRLGINQRAADTAYGHLGVAQRKQISDIEKTNAILTSIGLPPLSVPGAPVSPAPVQAPVPPVAQAPVQAPVPPVAQAPVQAPVAPQQVVQAPVQAPVAPQQVAQAPAQVPAMDESGVLLHSAQRTGRPERARPALVPQEAAAAPAKMSDMSPAAQQQVQVAQAARKRQDAQTVQQALPPLMQDLTPAERQAVGLAMMDNPVQGLNLRQKILENKPSAVAAREVARTLGKKQAERRAKLPSDVASVNVMASTIDRIVLDPALENATGWGYLSSFIPNTGSRRVYDKVQQLKSQAFLKGYQELKGGGHITEVEGEKAAKAITDINQLQSYEDVVSALGRLRAVVRGARRRIYTEAGLPVPAQYAVPKGIKTEIWDNMTSQEQGQFR